MSRFRRQMCVVCSAGGHLAEALAATKESSVDRYYVTKRDDHVAERLAGHKVYYVEDPHTSLWGYIKNVVQSLGIFLRERPKVILSTGSGIALATCLLGWLYGSKIVFIETGARVVTPSRTGRLMYRFSDVFYVQWKPLLKYYPKAQYVGRLV